MKIVEILQSPGKIKVVLISFNKKPNPTAMKTTKRKMINQRDRLSIAQILGAVLLAIGVLLIIICGLVESFSNSKDLNLKGISSLISIGFFMIMLGMAFFFPDMLKSSSTQTTSSMRVAVFMIVSVFVFLCVKIGWTCESFVAFKLDSTWAYILAVALGAKTVQSFSETRNLSGNLSNGLSNIDPSQNSNGQNNQNVPLHDLSTINNPPPNDPPEHILSNY